MEKRATSDAKRRKRSDKILDQIPNFIGEYLSHDLPSLFIYNYPISLIVKVEDSFLGICISVDSVEVIDPLGFLRHLKCKNLKRFLEAHTCGKTFYVSPQILEEGAKWPCFLFISIAFYLKFLIGISFQNYLELFHGNTSQNRITLDRISNLVEKYS